ncbi:mitogen activated protein kinase 15 [Echinococcus multilocularis]|uniref:Mitogen activated protein kinase 15 n=1 Tax=Echinococcus multilocularis TaxID=6211 RepID=A0A068Y3Y5_ECHMU|nr:mitogen activated protein kinase 15 [Echinococcus multilocularis]
MHRAPEILLSSTYYTKGVDMWSIGCILAEIFIGKALFPGTSTLNQLEKIMSIGPKPSREDILCLRSDYGASILDQPSIAGRRRLEDVVTPVPEPSALEMVRGLLQLNPNKRLTAAQALEHHYVSQFRDPESEIVMDHVVVPPLSDSQKLGVSEYRSRLYDMILETKSKRPQMKKLSSSESESASKDVSENGSSVSSSTSTGSSTVSLEDSGSTTAATTTTTASAETSATSPSTVSRSRIVAPPSPQRPIHLSPAKQRSEKSKPTTVKFQRGASCENGGKVPLKSISVTWIPNQENRKTTRKRQVYPDILVKNSQQNHPVRPSRRALGCGDAAIITTAPATMTSTMATSFTRSHDIPMILRGNENHMGSDGNLVRHYHPPGRQKTTNSGGYYEGWRRGGQRSASSGPPHPPLPPSLPNPANTVTHARLHRALAARPWIA